MYVCHILNSWHHNSFTVCKSMALSIFTLLYSWHLQIILTFPNWNSPGQTWSSCWRHLANTILFSAVNLTTRTFTLKWNNSVFVLLWLPKLALPVFISPCSVNSEWFTSSHLWQKMTSLEQESRPGWTPAKPPSSQYSLSFFCWSQFWNYTSPCIFRGDFLSLN